MLLLSLTLLVAMTPEEIPLGWYTHINFAFALVNPKTFHIAPMNASTAALYSRVTALKNRQPGLEVWIAIGGWAMNDPGPYRTTFSDLAKSEANQDAFFESLISFMQRYDFDGIDLDWEYPVADDRGGIPEDYDNLVTLLKRLRQRLNQTGKKYGLTITLVSPSQILSSSMFLLLIFISLRLTGTFADSTSSIWNPI